MFERESGDLDPEFDGLPRSAAEEGTELPEGYHATDSIPLTGESIPLMEDPAFPSELTGSEQPLPDAFHAQGVPDAPQDVPDTQGGELSGNRPADDALRSDSASQIDTAWRGSDAATDFLGLDEEVFVTESLEAEFTPVPDSYEEASDFNEFDEAGQLVEQSDPAGPPPGVDRESWLMGLDDADVERVGTDPLDSELDFPEQLDASYSEPDTKGKLGRWLVRGTAVAALLAVCVTLIKLYSANEAPVAEPTVPVQPTRGSIAREPGLSRPEVGRPQGELAAETSEVPGEDAGAAVQRESVTGDSSSPPVFDPALQGETTAEAIERAIRESQGNESVAADAGGDIKLDESGQRPAPDKLDPTGDARGVRDPFDEVALDAPGSATTTNGAGGTQTQGSETAPVIISGALSAQDPDSRSKGGLRYASTTDMAGTWDGTTIPLDSVSGATRIVTPNVGRVRAVMTSGQVFEGRMYAVGEGKIWIDNRLGRMALIGSSLATVEHVLSPDGAAELGAPGSQEYAGLPRVRAKAAGGVFFGKLIHQEGDRVILITEEGARLTLIGAQVDPAPSTRRVVVKGYDAAHAIQERHNSR